MMEGGGVAELRGVATLFGGVSDDDDAGLASFLQGAAEELKRGVAETVVDVGALVPVEAAAPVLAIGLAELQVAVEDMSEAEGTKGLASTLRADPTAAAGERASAGTNGDGLVDKVEVGGRYGVLLDGLKTEDAGEAVDSVGLDLVREAVLRKGVLVTGVVV